MLLRVCECVYVLGEGGLQPWFPQTMSILELWASLSQIQLSQVRQICVRVNSEQENRLSEH